MPNSALMEDRNQMIIEPKKTAVAYRCPDCGAGVMSAVDVFSLSADRVRLKCSDPECPSRKGNVESDANRHLDVVAVKDAEGGKVRLTVPCIFCGKPHTFTVNTSIFFGKDIFVMSCPSKVTVPPRLGIRPTTLCIEVVLPAPFAPMTP